MIISDIFDSYYHENYKTITSKVDWRYSFMPDDEYIKIKNPELMNSLYWKEILYRSHIVCLLTLIKCNKWIDGIILSKEAHHYYSLCANLRGFIESCADSFYTTRNIPKTMATNFEVIQRSINMNSQIVLINDLLENTLLHFIQGTKLSKEDKAKYPENYNAKTIKEYLSSISSDENDRIIQLYDYLCGITHPALESTSLFLFLYNGETIVSADCNAMENELVENILNCFADTLTQLFTIINTNIYETLKLLNCFDLAEVGTMIYCDNVISTLVSWKEIEALILDSSKKYSEALVVGKY